MAMDEKILDRELRRYFTDEVCRCEPTPEWWSSAVEGALCAAKDETCGHRARMSDVAT